MKHTLPDWTVVGFSGHRNLANPQVVAGALRKVLDELAASHGPLASVSSVACGADTLFVEEVARRNLPCLLVLPFPQNRFHQDFNEADWQRVLPLLENAARVEEIMGEDSPGRAYMEAGVITVDRADIMVVVWDEQPGAGFGGTSDVVNYARELGKPLIIIDPVSGDDKKERLKPSLGKSFMTGWNENPRQTVEKYFSELDRTAKEHGPKSRQLGFYMIVFQLLASAIGFFPHMFETSWVEKLLLMSLELAFILAALLVAWHHHKRHGQWLEDRSAAEICRSFLATWHVRRTDYFPQVSIQGFNRLCRNLRLIRTMDKMPAVSLEEARDRYMQERVMKQIAYFSRYGRRARRIYQLLKNSAWLSTVAAASLALLVGAVVVYEHSNGSSSDSNTFLKIFKYLSLVLPLASTAFYSLIITLDYSRRAFRYSEMTTLLKDSARRLRIVRTWSSLAHITAETESALLQEFVEWHSFRRFAGEPH